MPTLPRPTARALLNAGGRDRPTSIVVLCAAPPRSRAAQPVGDFCALRGRIENIARVRAFPLKPRDCTSVPDPEPDAPKIERNRKDGHTETYFKEASRGRTAQKPSRLPRVRLENREDASRNPHTVLATPTVRYLGRDSFLVLFLLHSCCALHWLVEDLLGSCHASGLCLV